MTYKLTAELLDSLEIAMCIFDSSDCAVAWNRHFVHFFPEHLGHIYAGEHYSENLRRFYRSRLKAEEIEFLERYVSDGVARHRTQTQPYFFEHKGRVLRVAIKNLPNGYRARVWNIENRSLVTSSSTFRSTAKSTSLPPAKTIQLLEELNEGAVIFDGKSANILYCNDHFVTQYGCASRESVIGHTFASLLESIWRAESHSDERLLRNQDLVAALRDGALFTGAPFAVPLPGERWMRVINKQTATGNFHSFHSDVTAVKREEQLLRDSEMTTRAQLKKLEMISEKLRSESFSDPLTGLANRRAFENELARLCLTAGPHALLYLDLDGFKPVNDELGHLAGDALLVKISHLLCNGVRAGDTVCRLGGDEFALLLHSCPEQKALQTARSLANKVAGESLHLSTTKLILGASVGVRCFSKGENPNTVLNEADIACYKAKKNGRGRAELYTST